MTILPLTYTRYAATCPTLGGRTGEADCSFKHQYIDINILTNSKDNETERLSETDDAHRQVATTAATAGRQHWQCKQSRFVWRRRRPADPVI